MKKILLIVFAVLLPVIIATSAINMRNTQKGLVDVPELKEASVPARGTHLGYEDYKDCQVPVVADGSGGSLRVVTDVPWDKFSIEEKFDMARVSGGHLSSEDIARIWFKFGEWRKAGDFYGIAIYKREGDNPK